MASILQTLLRNESGGRNIPNVTEGTSSGQAQGYFQITTGTWREFAQKVGVDLARYPTPMTAADGTPVPYGVQAAVASAIPLKRWAPSTVQLIRATGKPIDVNRPLGEVMAMNGEGFGSGPQDTGSTGFQPATTGGTGTLPPGYHGNLATAGSNNVDFSDPTSYLPPEKSPYEDLASTFADAVGTGGRKGLAGEQTLAPDQGETAKPPPFEYGSAIPDTPPPAAPPGSLAADAPGTGGLADLFKVGDFGQAGAAIDPMTGLPAPNTVLRTRRTYG
jgi:hypothetical protein